VAPVNSTLKVYVDDGEPAVQLRENVNGWHKAVIRQGVVDSRGTETDEFVSWKSRCLGRVVIQPEELDVHGNYTKIPRWYAYCETQEDFVSYVLTFEDPPERVEVVDVAAFYCPYVPLIKVGCLTENKNEI
jgi:hypothetical protein